MTSGSSTSPTARSPRRLTPPPRLTRPNMGPLDAAIPLGRMAQSTEIADVEVFLASGKAGYVTATTVVIDNRIMQGSVGL
jgi:hypothetical protein